MYIYGARGSILYGARVRRRVRTFGAQFTGSELTSQGPFLSIKMLPFPLLLVVFDIWTLDFLGLQTQVRNTARLS